jgi:hypothetical protein
VVAAQVAKFQLRLCKHAYALRSCSSSKWSAVKATGETGRSDCSRSTGE